MSRIKHCETCTCGLTGVEWSDRSSYVDLKDAADIADVIMNCALDHSYDRTGDGIPHGFPDNLRAALAPIVAKHLSAQNPNWENETVYMYDKKEARDAFLLELTSTAACVIAK